MKDFIQNADLLIDAFGKFPTFHDAEVIEMNLKRRTKDELFPILSSLIYIKNYKTGEKFVINLVFKSIFGLKLENFGHQNVLGNLFISEFSDEFFNETKKDKRILGVVGKAEIERLNYYVKFEYCFGVEAEFLCGEIVMDSVNPYTGVSES